MPKIYVLDQSQAILSYPLLLLKDRSFPKLAPLLIFSSFQDFLKLLFSELWTTRDVRLIRNLANRNLISFFLISLSVKKQTNNARHCGSGCLQEEMMWTDMIILKTNLAPLSFSEFVMLINQKNLAKG